MIANFRFSDLPSELQIRVLEKYFEEKDGNYYLCEQIEELDGRPKISSRFRSSYSVLNLLLVSHDFQRQTLEALRAMSCSYMLFCPKWRTRAELKDILKGRRLTVDIAITRTLCSLYKQMISWQSRFENLRSVTVWQVNGDFYDTNLARALKSYSLEEIYERKVPESEIVDAAEKDLTDALAKQNLSLVEFLENGAELNWSIGIPLGQWCDDNCGSCWLHFRNIQVRLIAQSSGISYFKTQIMMDGDTFKFMRVNYRGKDDELASMVAYVKAMQVGDAEKVKSLNALWEHKGWWG